MSNLILFLLVFDRASGDLVSIKQFDNEDLATSELSLEERKNAKNEHIEVVLIGSDSIETLKKTHGHYFSGKEINPDYNKLLNA